MLQRGAVNMIAGSDAVVTTAITLTGLVGLAAGRNLLTGEKIVPRRVLHLNAAVTQDELCRQIAAVRKSFGISTRDLGNRLFVQSVAGQLLHVARLNAHGHPEIVETAVQWLEDFITQNAIDVLAPAPLIAFHRVNPSADFDMQTVAGEVFGGIAARTRCAIELGNHLTKKSDDVSGAPAVVHAMTMIRTVTTMTASEADRHGVAERERNRYVKIESNTGEAAWFRLDKIGLNADQIDIAVPWQPRPLIAIGSKTASRPSRVGLPKTAQRAPERAARGNHQSAAASSNSRKRRWRRSVAFEISIAITMCVSVCEMISGEASGSPPSRGPVRSLTAVPHRRN
jgi:hypothetical protein